MQESHLEPFSRETQGSHLPHLDALPNGLLDAHHGSDPSSTPHTSLLIEQAPILRRMRPLVRHVESKGVPVYHMGVGCLKVNPPSAIMDHLKSAPLRPEPYPQSYGQTSLLEALSTYLSQALDVQIKPQDSIIVPGGLGAVFTALSLCTDVGDAVAIVRPSWPNTPLLARLYGRKVKEILCASQQEWRLPSLESLLKDIGLDTRLLIIERPSNPTGAVWNDEELQILDGLLDLRPALTIFADEEYFELSSERPRSILELNRDRIISGAGFSKSLALTSARLGRLTTFDRHLRTLLIPWCNVWLGSNNLLGLQEAIADSLQDRGPRGVGAYLGELNDFIRQARQEVRSVFQVHPHVSLLPGKGAYYDVLLFKSSHIDAEQVLLHRLLTSLEAVEAEGPGPSRGLPFTYVMPLRGFYRPSPHHSNLDGFRLTLSLYGEELRQALKTLSAMIEAYIEADLPHYGSIETVIKRRLGA